MRYFLAALFVLSMLGTPARAEEQKLYIYIWDTYAAPELFKKFEAETGIEVVTDIYSSNDVLMAKLKAGGGYDVVAPSGNYVPGLIAEKLLMPLPDDLKKLAAGMDEKLRRPAYDPDNAYVLPLFYGTTSFAMNAKLTKEEFTSWSQFFTRPEGEAPSIGVLDDIGTLGNLLSLALGKPFCDNSPETFKAMQEMLLKQKPFVKVYGATGYFERLAANEVALQMAWNGDAYKTRLRNKNIRYVYPKEGVELWADNLAIPATAKNVEAAKKFIAFALKPENAAAYAATSGFASSITASVALLPEEMRAAPELNIPAGVKTEVSTACPPEVIGAYNKIWERVVQ